MPNGWGWLCGEVSGSQSADDAMTTSRANRRISWRGRDVRTESTRAPDACGSVDAGTGKCRLEEAGGRCVEKGVSLSPPAFVFLGLCKRSGEASRRVEWSSQAAASGCNPCRVVLCGVVWCRVELCRCCRPTGGVFFRRASDWLRAVGLRKMRGGDRASSAVMPSVLRESSRSSASGASLSSSSSASASVFVFVFGCVFPSLFCFRFWGSFVRAHQRHPGGIRGTSTLLCSAPGQAHILSPRSAIDREPTTTTQRPA